MTFILFTNIVNAQSKRKQQISSFGTNPKTTNVRTYQKSNGTVVRTHKRTKQNNTNWDNYSTKGNSNIYTGKYGSRAKDYSSDAYNYGKGKHIKTGPRGGQYYNTNNKSKKTYVPKRR